MGAMSGLLGTAGGINGTGMKGPEGISPEQGVTNQDVSQSEIGARQGISSQQALLNALQGQGGIGNQASAFNQAQALQNQLDSARGISRQSEALNSQNALAQQQQGLAQQYQNIANGTGPNPAQAMLNNATGQNAALMAGQRGAGSNVGLMARQAGQQGASTQQQAVGQAAQMQAQQQLSALQGIGAQQQAIGNTYQNVAGIGGQLTAAQMAQQGALANQASQQVGQQMGATSGLSQAQQAQQAAMLGGQQNQNANAVGMQGNINNANTTLANTTMQGQQGLIGGALKGIATGGGMAKAYGGPVHMFVGGEPEVEAMAPAEAPPQMANPAPVPAAAPAPIAQPQAVAPAAAAGPQSDFGKFIDEEHGAAKAAVENMGLPSSTSMGYGSSQLEEGAGAVGGAFQHAVNKVLNIVGMGGKDDGGGGGGGLAGAGEGGGGMMAMVAAEGGLAHSGGNVAAKSPDQKAEKPGNSYANDKIPALLSEGEVVIPRDIMSSADPSAAAAEFVRQTLAKRGSPGKKAFSGEDDRSQEVVAQESPAQLPTPQGSDGQGFSLGVGGPQQQVADATPQAAPSDQPEETAATPAATMPQQPAEPTAAQDAQNMNNHDLLLQQDMAMGKIQPKTYNDLYHEKSTLGKLGTLFGLVIGGAGAGLTHTSNPVLDMMDKEIERDLHGQQSSNTNTQNWYNMAKAHELQRYQQEKLHAETQSQLIGNIGHGYETAITKEKLRQTAPGADTTIPDIATNALIHAGAVNKAGNAMRIGLGQTFQDTLNKMGPGQAKQVGQNVLNNQIWPAINAKNAQKNAVTAARKKAIKAVAGTLKNAPASNDAAPQNQVDEDKLLAALNAGKTQLPGFGFRKGAIDPQLEMPIQEEKSKLEFNRDGAKALTDSFNRLAQKRFSGQAPGIDAATTGLAGAIGTAAGTPVVGAAAAAAGHMLGKMTSSAFTRERDIEKEGLMSRFPELGEDKVDAMLPSYADSPESMARAYQNAIQFFRDKERKETPKLRSAASQIKGLVYPEDKFYSGLKFTPPKKGSGAENTNKLESDAYKIWEKMRKDQGM